MHAESGAIEVPIAEAALLVTHLDRTIKLLDELGR
jgi:hypothetical protein